MHTLSPVIVAFMYLMLGHQMPGPDRCASHMAPEIADRPRALRLGKHFFLFLSVLKLRPYPINLFKATSGSSTLNLLTDTIGRVDVCSRL